MPPARGRAGGIGGVYRKRSDLSVAGLEGLGHLGHLLTQRLAVLDTGRVVHEGGTVAGAPEHGAAGKRRRRRYIIDAVGGKDVGDGADDVLLTAVVGCRLP